MTKTNTAGRRQRIQEFHGLLASPKVAPQEFEACLDEMSGDERVAVVRSLGRRQQRTLFERVDGYRPVRLSHLVPPGIDDLATVRHHGRNTLPAFTHFEKRFCRPRREDPSQPTRLFGFNFQSAAWLTGPGYFVARDLDGRPEVVVDYTAVPEAGAECPADWPPVRGNEGIPARFVYGFMLDTLRGVSDHVTVGSAARRGRDLGSWFTLCREE